MIIGLNGYARAGKDTVGLILKEDYGFETVSFAEALKAFVLALDVSGLTDGEYQKAIATAGSLEAAKDRFPVTRLRLQQIGVLARETISPTVWIDAALNRYNTRTTDIVITDMRFPNEMDAVLDRLGITVRVDRPGVGPANDHQSETRLDTDYVLVNDGTIADLHNKVRAMMEEVN